MIRVSKSLFAIYVVSGIRNRDSVPTGSGSFEEAKPLDAVEEGVDIVAELEEQESLADKTSSMQSQDTIEDLARKTEADGVVEGANGAKQEEGRFWRRRRRSPVRRPTTTTACWSNSVQSLTCIDGTELPISSNWNWPSCDSHGGRARCPSHWPWMCADRTNTDNMAQPDWWCKQSVSDCGAHGGLRPCQDRFYIDYCRPNTCCAEAVVMTAALPVNLNVCQRYQFESGDSAYMPILYPRGQEYFKIQSVSGTTLTYKVRCTDSTCSSCREDSSTVTAAGACQHDSSGVDFRWRAH